MNPHKYSPEQSVNQRTTSQTRSTELSIYGTDSQDWKAKYIALEQQMKMKNSELRLRRELIDGEDVSLKKYQTVVEENELLRKELTELRGKCSELVKAEQFDTEQRD